MNELVQICDLTKVYERKKVAVNHMNLMIPSGRIVGLLGPNGSGKTTLIKMLSGLLVPDQGTIRISGNAPGPVTKAEVSYLPERTYFRESMKVSQLIAYFKDFYADFRPERAMQMLNNLQIDPNAPLKTLSKGTKEKVQLIMVMSRDARLYLLDEPENSLSADYQQALARFLEDSARFYRCQLVIATHSPFLLALKGAAVYDLDAQPPCRRPWRELPAMQTWAAFFRAHQGEWEDDKEENHETR